MTQSELLEILERHRKWLAKESDGRPADLRGADLYKCCLPLGGWRYAHQTGQDADGATNISILQHGVRCFRNANIAKIIVCICERVCGMVWKY